MAKCDNKQDDSHAITVEEVKRLLEIGKLLVAVLTPEELEQLHLTIKSFGPKDNSCCKKDQVLSFK